METMAFDRSYSPPSILRTSAASTSVCKLVEAALEVAGHVLALRGPFEQDAQVVDPPAE
jgi:hypothetical protein